MQENQCLKNHLFIFRYKVSVAQGEPIGVVMKMARRECTSPALFAKLILDQYHLERNAQKKSHKDSCEKKEDKSLPTQNEGKFKTSIPGEGKNIVSKQIRDSSLIADGRLAKELLLVSLNASKIQKPKKIILGNLLR